MQVRGQRPLVTLAIPMFNEAVGIGQTLSLIVDCARATLSDYDWELLVVDDGSSDETLATAEETIRANGIPARLLAHDVNCGLGSALTTLFCQARGDVIVTIDADLTYDVTHIPRLIRAWEETGAAVVVASPYTAEGRTVDVPADLEARSRVANRYLTAMAKRSVRTYTGMVRAYDGDFARSLPPLRSGPSANVEALCEAFRWGKDVVEIPAVLDWSGRAHRRSRSSVINWKSLSESALVLADGVKLRRVRHRAAASLSTATRPKPQIVIDLTQPQGPAQMSQVSDGPIRLPSA